MGKSTISMAIFNSYFDITRGYPEFPTQSNPYSGLTAIRSIHGPMAGWDDFTDLRRGKLTQVPAGWQIGEELRTTSLYPIYIYIYIYKYI